MGPETPDFPQSAEQERLVGLAQPALRCGRAGGPGVTEGLGWRNVHLRGRRDMCLSLSPQHNPGAATAERLLLPSQSREEVSGVIVVGFQSPSEEPHCARQD